MSGSMPGGENKGFMTKCVSLVKGGGESDVRICTRKFCTSFSMASPNPECFISKLPDEILAEVFSLLPLEELVSTVPNSSEEYDSDDPVLGGYKNFAPQIEVLASVSRQFKSVATGISNWIETTSTIDRVILAGHYEEHWSSSCQDRERFIAGKPHDLDLNSLC
jgi:hypothetical protein